MAVETPVAVAATDALGSSLSADVFSRIKSSFGFRFPEQKYKCGIVGSHIQKGSYFLQGMEVQATIFERMDVGNDGSVQPCERIILKVTENSGDVTRWVLSERGVEAFNLKSQRIPIEGWRDVRNTEESKSLLGVVLQQTKIFQ